jgi:NADPH:quinone reductase-like Zn-dependent oxidoreductase
MAQAMKAVVFEAAGKPADVLALRHVVVPRPSSAEALIRVDARPIQSADIMFIGGRYRIKPQCPQVAGLEGSGTVVSVGAGVSIRFGTRVSFHHPGSWAEFAVVPVERLSIVPEGIPVGTAAQFSLSPITAWALLDELRACKGDWIAINAATSSISQLVRSLARRRGVSVVSIVGPGRRLEDDGPMLHSDVPSLSDSVLDLTSAVPIAGLLDNIGGGAITDMLPAMRQGATIVSFGVLEPAAANIANSDIVCRNLTWKGFGIEHWLANSWDRRASMVHELWSAIGSGAMVLPVRARYGLERFKEAIADARAGDRPGKVLIAD